MRGELPDEPLDALPGVRLAEPRGGLLDVPQDVLLDVPPGVLPDVLPGEPLDGWPDGWPAQPWGSGPG